MVAPVRGIDAAVLTAARAQAITAVAARKLRVEWATPRPARLTDGVVLGPLWLALRARWPGAPGSSQDERVTLRVLEAGQDSCRLGWDAVFDLDYAAMYDRTEAAAGELVLEIEAEIDPQIGNG